MSELAIDQPYVSRIAVIEDRRGDPYDIYHGLHPFYLRQLIGRSREPLQMTQVPDDAGRRFRDEAAIRQWLASGHKQLYYLLQPAQPGQLQGCLWYARETRRLAGRTYHHSLAIRLYEGAQGRGLAKPFMRRTLRHLLSGNETAHDGLWLSTLASNAGNIALYAACGYETVDQDDKGRTFMVLSPEQTAEFCAGA